jgi:hypothetical protein
LIWILQVAAKTQQRVKKHFARRPLESFKPSQICPWLATLEVSGASQCGPWGLGWRGSPDSGDLAGGLGRGSSWGGSRSFGEPTWVLTHGGEATGGWVWRRPAAADAGSSAPTSWQLGPGNKQRGKLWGVLGEVGASRDGGASGWSQGFTVGTKTAAMAAW